MSTIDLGFFPKKVNKLIPSVELWVLNESWCLSQHI